MQAKLSRAAEKMLDKLNEPHKSRAVIALRKLEKNPPEGDIKKLTGRDGYRLRFGAFRILFDVENDYILVYKIERRGQVYKGGR